MVKIINKHMDYTLAKRLKDAGFPNEGGLTWVKPDGILYSGGPESEEDVYVPTLEELIEACSPEIADDFGINTCGDKWEAYLIYHGYFDEWTKFSKLPGDGFKDIDVKAEGTTPLEAVVNLWLALNIEL